MAEPTDLVVTADRLAKRFGRQWVLRDLSDVFKTGEIIGVRGRNGSGKSTLLRLLSGQLTPSRGAVTWSLAGKPVDVGAIYGSVSWIGPYTELVEELTVRESLNFHFGFKPTKDSLSTAEIIDRIELTAAADRPLYDCSSGMRQRVLLATALYADTPLLLLDEPTVTLDRPATVWFAREFDRFGRGRLTIVASNDTDDLARCTRLLDL